MTAPTAAAPRSGILSTIGRTPLVRLDGLLRPRPWTLQVKLEALNPAGSVKDRAALRIIEDAIERGDIRVGTMVVESSSGNMGVGLAMACAYHRLRFTCVVDPHTSDQSIRLMRAYGATVEIVTEECPQTRSYLQARLRRVQQILDTVPDVFWPNQYENPSGVAAHYETTAPSIVNQLGGFPDWFFCPVGTCATIQGCASFFRDQDAPTIVVGVDSIGSTVLGGAASARRLPGIGSVREPTLLDRGLIDIAVKVSEDDAIRWCKTVAREEAVLVGGSSGATIAAIAQMREQIPVGATVVGLLPDGGDRYLGLIFEDRDHECPAGAAHGHQ